MKRVTIVKYVAFDGTEFDNEEKCIEYETTGLYEYYKPEMDAVKTLKNFCMGRGCGNCIFHSDTKISDTYCKLKQQAPHLWTYYDLEEN
jgi:ribosomal protein S27AE